jgi:hypothetical protein
MGYGAFLTNGSKNGQNFLLQKCLGIKFWNHQRPGRRTKLLKIFVPYFTVRWDVVVKFFYRTPSTIHTGKQKTLRTILWNVVYSTVHVWGSCKDDCKDDSKVLWEEDDSVYSPLKENLMRMLYLGKKISTKLVVLTVLVSGITYIHTIQRSGAEEICFIPWAMGHDDVSPNESCWTMLPWDNATLGQCVPTPDPGPHTGVG